MQTLDLLQEAARGAAGRRDSSGWNAATVTGALAARAPGGRRRWPAPRRRAGPLDDRRPDEHGVERPAVEAVDVEVGLEASRPGGRRRCGARRCRSAPKQRWSGRPSSTSVASRIIPAQVPNAGMPVRRAARPAGRTARLTRAASTSWSTRRRAGPARRRSSSSAGVRTSTGSAPSVSEARGVRGERRPAARARRPSRPAPGGLRGASGATSPARPAWSRASSISRPGMAAPRPAADLGEDVRVAEVGGGLDDGLGPAGRVRRS